MSLLLRRKMINDDGRNKMEGEKGNKITVNMSTSTMRNETWSNNTVVMCCGCPTVTFFRAESLSTCDLITKLSTWALCPSNNLPMIYNYIHADVGTYIVS
jgi:hypothetical protein